MSLNVITYHYVRKIKKSKYSNLKGLEFSLFKKQINFFKKNFEIISMEQFLNEDYKKKKKNILLTFDDGLNDHYKFVFPFLMSKKIKGSFFAPVNSTEKRTILEVHKLQFIFEYYQDKRSLLNEILGIVRKHKINIESLYKKQITLIKKNDHRFNDKYTNIIRNLIQYILPKKVSKMIVSEYFNIILGKNKNFVDDLYMTTEQMREMINNGMHFGSHGKKHVWLEYEKDKEQLDEINSSKNFLIKNGINQDSLTICYPFGSYNFKTLKILKKLNFKAGFTTNFPRSNKISNKLIIPRYDTNDFLDKI